MGGRHLQNGNWLKVEQRKLAAIMFRSVGQFSLFRRNHFLDKCFEARIAAQGIEQRIHFDPGETGTVPGGDGSFNGAKSLLFVVNAQEKESARILVRLLILSGS